MATDHAALALDSLALADDYRELLDRLLAETGPGKPDNRAIHSARGFINKHASEAKIHGQLAVAQAVRELHDLAAATAMGRTGL